MHLACSEHGQVMVNEHLYFGTATPDGTVSDDQWKQFLAETVTPRFPDGLTHWRASGQWRGERGVIQEDAYILNILRQDTTDSDLRIAEIAATYKDQFDQESVLRVSDKSCVSF